jgi:hypothetical protein
MYQVGQCSSIRQHRSFECLTSSNSPDSCWSVTKMSAKISTGKLIQNRWGAHGCTNPAHPVARQNKPRTRTFDIFSINTDSSPPAHSLTYTMQKNPSREANPLLASEKISNILWNPNVHYSVYMSPPSVPIPSKINPVTHPTS